MVPPPSTSAASCRLLMGELASTSPLPPASAVLLVAFIHGERTVYLGAAQLPAARGGLPLLLCALGEQIDRYLS